MNENTAISFETASEEGVVVADVGYATQPAREVTLELPDHQVALTPDMPWAVWRWVCLRGAGFPATDLLQLASSKCAAASDAMIGAGEDKDRAREGLMSALDAELSTATPDEYESLREQTRAIRQRLKKNKLPEQLSVGPGATEAIGLWSKANSALAEAETNFAQEYEREVERISGTICEIAGYEPFREAVLWQSCHALHTALDSLLKTAPDGKRKRNTQRRQHEELVASYLQRYCAKNDTVGFFGPVGWARVVADGPAIVSKPGSSLLATRNVYFESWTIDALVEEIVASDKTILRWASPRLLPLFYIDGQILKRPLESPVPLSSGQAALLQACDGTQTAQEIARSLIPQHGKEFRSETDVYRVIEFLRTKGVVYWNFEVPYTPHPERKLKELLSAVENVELRDFALAKLATLEEAREGIANAAGSSVKLDQAMEDLQSTFTQVTGKAPARSAGKMYAGRTLVYEDCRRDVDVELGPEFMQALGPPMSLLLTSARWLTYKTAAQCRTMLKRIYAELSRETQCRQLDASNVWLRIYREILTSEPSPIATLISEFYDRWSAVLKIPVDARQVCRSSDSLKERVLETFDSPGPGWYAARYHSPDVMVMASSAEAIRQGDYDLVMGELHTGVNTLGLALFLEQHPAKHELYEAAALDIPEPRIIVSPLKHVAGLSGRNHMALALPKDFRLEFGAASDKVEVGQRLALGSLVIEQINGEVVAKTRDGAHQFSLMELMADALTAQVLNGFKLLRPDTHLPRVKIDRLIVSRESWTIAVSEIDFAHEKSGATRFVNARRWARAHGMPRFVFMKSPVEVKPVYVDFDSPIYVDLFAKIIRRTSESKGETTTIAISEMLPRLDQTWLRDIEGRRYTSEFRIVAVDRNPMPSQ
jgi:Lantibiotic dehydratase, N terminus